MIARLGALLGLWPAVWTEDHDYEVRLRIARNNKRSKVNIFGSSIETGGVYVYGIGFFGKHLLLPDGTCRKMEEPERCGYVNRWKEWKYNRKHVVF